MLLSNIPQYIKCKKIYNYRKKNKQFFHLSTNSKTVKKNSVLVVSNQKFKIKYIHEAIKNGAQGLITYKYFQNIKLTQFVVKDTFESLKILLFKINNIPPKNIVGVTGTNGKTSVVWNISQICYFAGVECKTIGTLGYYKNNRKITNTSLTTPEFDFLHQKAFLSRTNHYNFVFEVSSHSISKKRVNNFPINIAVLTNISQDHLDFHKSMKNYRNTKLKLFTRHLRKNGISIFNDKIRGISHIKKQLKKKNIKILSYGKADSDVFANYKNKLKLKIFNKKFNLNHTYLNKFELENLTCAICCSIAMGISIDKIVTCINKISKPPGRLDLVSNLKDNYKVFVDYAHTPDALKNVLKHLTINKRKPNVVFGCGGNRDKVKRKAMGNIANKYANKVYITDDNPRLESPKTIRKSIISMCPRSIEIPNRREAIKKSINDLKKGDVLIIAGKGHEKIQILKDKIINFDDVKIAKYYLNKL